MTKKVMDDALAAMKADLIARNPNPDTAKTADAESQITTISIQNIDATEYLLSSNANAANLMQAMQDIREGRNVVKFDSLEDLFESLDKSIDEDDDLPRDVVDDLISNPIFLNHKTKDSDAKS